MERAVAGELEPHEKSVRRHEETGKRLGKCRRGPTANASMREDETPLRGELTLIETASPTTPVRVRWFRRRPPAWLDRFGRGVWWTGQAQLFIAALLTLTAPLLLLSGFWGSQMSFYGYWAIAFAGPVLISGLLLRWAAQYIAAPEGDGLGYPGWSWRIARLLLAVLFIGMLAIGCVFGSIVLLIIGGIVVIVAYITGMLVWIALG
jgi:hypothetical protein